MQISLSGLWPREGIGGILAVLAGSGRAGPEDAPSDGTALPEEFRTHYAAVIRPRIEEFEQRRLAALATYRTRLFVFIAALAAIVPAGAMLLGSEAGRRDPHLVIVGMFLAALGVWLWARAPARRYRSAVKGEIYPDIFRYFGDDFAYAETGPLSARALVPSGIIPGFDNEHREDHVSGTYNGVALELTEARLTETRGSGKHRRTVTVFRGMFVRLAMNKNFSGHTVVTRDRGLLNWLGGISRDLERVRLEDPEFEDRFEVYSSDQIEARYLLTPAFMERLLELGSLFGARNVTAAFYENRLLILVDSTLDRFEGGSILRPATFRSEIATILAEMAVIFRIVDILRLHEQTRI